MLKLPIGDKLEEILKILNSVDRLVDGCSIECREDTYDRLTCNSVRESINIVKSNIKFIRERVDLD